MPPKLPCSRCRESLPKITQYKLKTTGRDKLADLAQIILSGGYGRVMVFCNTKFTTATLCNQLARLNFQVDCLHGDLSQAERNKIMTAFREGKLKVLVATDEWRPAALTWKTWTR